MSDSSQFPVCQVTLVKNQRPSPVLWSRSSPKSMFGDGKGRHPGKIASESQVQTPMACLRQLLRLPASRRNGLLSSAWTTEKDLFVNRFRRARPGRLCWRFQLGGRTRRPSPTGRADKAVRTQRQPCHHLLGSFRRRASRVFTTEALTSRGPALRSGRLQPLSPPPVAGHRPQCQSHREC